MKKDKKETNSTISGKNNIIQTVFVNPGENNKKNMQDFFYYFINTIIKVFFNAKDLFNRPIKFVIKTYRFMEKTKINFFLILALFVFIFTVIAINNAWVSDDAYITFRVIDNFISGHGLTWNVSERVQAYTHPLWMFVLSFFYFFTKEIYFTNIIISILFSIFTIIVLYAGFNKNRLFFIVYFIILISSKAFMDYTTSGLENPLSYLLLALFFSFFYYMKFNIKNLAILSLIASLGILNRMDIAIFFMPALLYFYIKTKKPFKGLLVLLAGFTPFIAWEFFSLLYYGFLFPNTAYAKLNTGIHTIDLLKQSIEYFTNSLSWDPITLITLTVSIVSFTGLIKDKKNLPLIAGIILYMAYIVKTGGDFMSGRFFSCPLLCAVIVLSKINVHTLKKIFVPLLVIIIFIGSRSIQPPLLSNKEYTNKTFNTNGIVDERGWYYKDTGLLRADKNKINPSHKWVNDGLELKKSGKKVYISGFVGITGFFAGPEIYIIDYHGLTDAFLARLHITDIKKWRIGHFIRELPEFYVNTKISGKNFISDKFLAVYYDRLSEIISSNVWSIKRLKLIINFNSGKYNYLIEHRQKRLRKISIKKTPVYVSDGTSWCDEKNILMSEYGLLIDLRKKYYSNEIEICLDGNDEYSVEFSDRKKNNGIVEIKPVKIPKEGMHSYKFELSEKIKSNGFDKIKIIPLNGDEKYSLGHVKLE